MLKLGGGGVAVDGLASSGTRIVVRVSTELHRPLPLRAKEAYLADTEPLPPGYLLYVALRANAHVLRSLPPNIATAILPDDYSYLSNGDVIRLAPARGEVRVLYRRASDHNSLLMTERCNHYCLMCSQPPKNHDDSWILQELYELIPLIDPSTRTLGLTGGEPTLLGDGLLRVLRLARAHLPRTSVHLLSNGRRFADRDFAHAYGQVAHPDLMVGIPIYSDLSHQHDYIVQDCGAFDETVRGIINLRREGQKVEVRVVLHRKSTDRLPRLAEFITRNLTFVDHVALMGLEMTGFTRANLLDLWIDPADYQTRLYEAASTLADAGMSVSIYNHQLCLLDRRLWPLAKKSISDWKNEYMPECAGCSVVDQCGGFFSSARVRYSDHIAPVLNAR